MSCDEGERRGKWEVQDGRSTIEKKYGKLDILTSGNSCTS
jgi:hypothetical protein